VLAQCKYGERKGGYRFASMKPQWPQILLCPFPFNLAGYLWLKFRKWGTAQGHQLLLSEKMISAPVPSAVSSLCYQSATPFLSYHLLSQEQAYLRRVWRVKTVIYSVTGETDRFVFTLKLPSAQTPNPKKFRLFLLIFIQMKHSTGLNITSKVSLVPFLPCPSNNPDHHR